MPRSSTGKWVARAGATGGGRTYRGNAPVNWYTALVVIVLVGLVSVGFSRHEYQTGPTKNTTPPVKTGTVWYAAAVFDVCGTQKVIPSDVGDTKTQSFYTGGDGLIAIAPKKTADAGANATFGKFVSSYKGLTVTSTEIVLPAGATVSSATTTTTTTSTTTTSTTSTSTPSSTSTSTTGSTTSTTAKTTAATSKIYKNGATCAKGTKYAGKKADVEVTYWPSAVAGNLKPVTYSGDPATLRFTDYQLITVGFVPPGTTLPKPSGSVVTALLQLATGTTSTGTTTTTTATTTAASTTTTPSTTTTAPASTTTTSTTSTSSG
ncbi:MAG: hypothetical protein ACRDWE_13220 [Acidimicrobiales bacterium]